MRKISPNQSSSLTAAHFHTIREIAELLQVSQKTVRRWIDQGDLVAHRFGRQLRISRADFEAFVRLRREG